MGGDSLLIWSAAAHQQYSMICGSNSVFSSLLVCWHNILVTLVDRGEVHTTRKRSRNGLGGDLLKADFWPE